MNELYGDAVAFGAAIKKARRAAGVSQERLGELVGVSKSTVVRWENGGDGNDRTPQRRRSIAAAIAEVIEVDRAALGLTDSRNGATAVERLQAEVRKLADRFDAEVAELHEAMDALSGELADVRKQTKRGTQRSTDAHG